MDERADCGKLADAVRAFCNALRETLSELLDGIQAMVDAIRCAYDRRKVRGYVRALKRSRRNMATLKKRGVCR